MVYLLGIIVSMVMIVVMCIPMLMRVFSVFVSVI
jgi:hypothetical protein